MTTRPISHPQALLAWQATNRSSTRTGWYELRNAADRAVVDLYDEIGFMGVSASEFVKDLRAIKATNIELRVNSPGGSIMDGLAIYNALRDHPARVDTVVDGIAASAASWVILAGDSVTMNRFSQLMIHDGMGLTLGSAADHREAADLLDKLSNNIAAIYASRAGGTAEQWRAAMTAETWYSADEAVQAGLADQVVSDPAPPTNVRRLVNRSRLIRARAHVALKEGT